MKAVAPKVSVIAAILIGANAIALSTYRSSSASSAELRREGSVATGNSLVEIDRVIAGLERQIKRSPTSSSLDLLARMQLSRGRITGDAASYARAQAAIVRSLSIAPKNLEGRTLDAEVRYTNHEFAEARRLSTAIVDEAPGELGALAIQADAERELGDYEAAGRTMRRLVGVAGTAPSVIVRDARLSFLTGKSARSVQLGDLAEQRAELSGLLGATLSFYPSFRGQLAFDTGSYKDAIKHFTRALRIVPGDRVATLGLARSLAATGKENAALALVQELTDRYPDPVAHAFLGDLRTKVGDRRGANDAYALVEAVADLSASNRQVYDRELSLFYANHGRNVAEALRLARSEAVVRKDVYAYDTLAWAEYKSGNIGDAAAAIRKALSLNTPDSRIHFHAGMIFSKAGSPAEARRHLQKALQLSPQFDVLAADVARAELIRLGGRS